MSAYEIPNLRFSAPTGAAVTRRRFVKLDASGNAVQVAADTEYPVGVSSNDASASGQVLEIYDGIVIVEAGAAVPLLAGGTPVMADASGRAIPYVAGAGVVMAGTAMTAASAAGELITVKTAN